MKQVEIFVVEWDVGDAGRMREGTMDIGDSCYVSVST